MSINVYELGNDLLNAQRAVGYNTQFQVKLISRDYFNPFRAYLYYRGEWWPVLITLDSYPIYSKPNIVFEQKIPPCSKHPTSWHPNIFDDGRICWGTAEVFPNMRIVGLLNTLYGLLQTPNHDSPVPNRCSVVDKILGVFS